MSVEDAFPGGVVVGWIVSGEVAVGDPVEVVGPSGPAPATVTRVDRNALTLSGATARRGDVLAAPGTVFPHDEFDARITFNPESDLQRPLDPARFRFYFHTAVVPGVATRAEPGVTVDVGVRLAEPVPMVEGQRFAIRQGGSNVGHGVVTGLLFA
jgi:elongation factor Tu